jgi:hypothetical protein
MEEHLLAYLLDTLDPATRQRVEAWLDAHPEGRERLEVLRRAIAPLADDPDPAPPPGLAESALAFVAAHSASAPRPRDEADTRPPRWGRRIDWAVAACMLVLAGGLLPPVCVKLWTQQQRLSCGNNLRKFWVALQGYSDTRENDLPRVEARGPRAVAGVFLPILSDAGLAPDVSVACPAREQRRPLRCSVEDLERLYRERPADYAAIARELAGHYAYCIGYSQGTSHLGLRRDSGDLLPILADCPSPGGSTSPNHGGAGQNVLYVGGQVRWAPLPTVGQDGDNIFLNRDQRVRAGVCRTDSVLAPSNVQPYPTD